MRLPTLAIRLKTGNGGPGPTLTGSCGVVHTPAVLPGDEVEVTATWDVRDRRGDYLITVTADAFSQIVEARTDNNSASVHVAVADARVDIAESPN